MVCHLTVAFNNTFVAKRVGIVLHDQLFWVYFASPYPPEKQLVFVSYDGTMCRKHYRLSDAEKRAHPSGFVITAYDDEQFIHELLSENSNPPSIYTYPVDVGSKTFHFSCTCKAADFKERMNHRLYPYPDKFPYLLYQFKKEEVFKRETNKKEKKKILTNMDIFKVGSCVHIYARHICTITQFMQHAYRLHEIVNWDVMRNGNDVVIKNSECKWKEDEQILFGQVNFATSFKYLSECAYRLKKHALNKP